MREVAHDGVHALVELVSQLLVHEVFVPLVHLPDVVVNDRNVLEVLLVQLHHVRTLLLLLCHDRHRVQGLLVQTLEVGKSPLQDRLLVI